MVALDTLVRRALRAVSVSLTMELARPWLHGRAVGLRNSSVVGRRVWAPELRCRFAGSFSASGVNEGHFRCSPLCSSRRLSNGPVHSAATEVELCPESALSPVAHTGLGVLNREQVQAVTSDACCVRVLAGPGSGKTRVLTHRIAHLIQDRGVSPSNILGITFTNKAANEICERLETLLKSVGGEKPTTGTFHSVCGRILRKDIGELEIGLTKNFIIYDERDSEKLLKQICREVLAKADSWSQSPSDSAQDSVRDVLVKSKYAEGEQGKKFEVAFAAKLLYWITGQIQEKDSVSDSFSSRSREILKKDDITISPKKMKELLKRVLAIRTERLNQFIVKRRGVVAAKKPADDLFVRLAFQYEAGLRSSNAIDYDDMLGLTVKLLHLHPSVLKYWQSRWNHVLVDEFQDTNQVQYEFVRLLCQSNRNLFVVGDVDQSIYGWRGADFRNMQSYLKAHFSEMVTYELRKNYRSSENIIKLASFIISQGRAGTEQTKEKPLEATLPAGLPVTISGTEDEYAEARYCVQQISRYVQNGQGSWGSCAVMYRARVQRLAVQSALQQACIPFRVYGETTLLQHKETKDLQAYLILVLNLNHEVALRRVINTPPRGIGDKSLEAIEKWGSTRGLPLPKAIEAYAQELPSVKEVKVAPKARKAVSEFCELIQELRLLKESSSVSDIIDTIITRTNYLEYLEGQASNENGGFEKKLEHIRQFKALADYPDDSGDEEDSITQFLQNCSLMRGDTDKQNVVKLMTLHAAKGLEFKCVFLIGLEDGYFPVSLWGEELAEERRLFYVGITRAERKLYLTYKKKCYLKDRSKQVDVKPSRFLSELLDSRSSPPLESVEIHDLTTLSALKSLVNPAYGRRS